MYQSLIWSAVLCNHPSGMRPPLDAQDLERAANPLIDGVGGDSQLACNLLGREMLVDQAKTIELTRA
jgi:hypothetical protein